MSIMKNMNFASRLIVGTLFSKHRVMQECIRAIPRLGQSD